MTPDEKVQGRWSWRSELQQQSQRQEQSGQELLKPREGRAVSGSWWSRKVRSREGDCERLWKSVQWGRGSQTAQCLFPKILHRSKFLCVLLHLYPPALMASFVDALLQHQSLDASVPLMWSPRGLLLVALLLEASLPLLLTFYLAMGKVGSIW